MLKPALLIIDDDKEFVDDFMLLLKKDFNCSYKLNPENGIKEISSGSYDIVLLDLMFKGKQNGLEVLKQIRKLDEELPVIMITDYGSINTAIEAMKIGAFDYVSKSPNLKELKLLIDKAINQRLLKYRNKELEKNVNKPFNEIVGNSLPIKNLKRKIKLFADNDNTVLILGESGVGKELVAHQIHQLSSRKNKPFVAINCAALPKDLIESELFGHEKGAFTGAVKKKLGKFELAMDGTIFLDEVAELDLNAQIKLLRILQEREFDRVGGTSTLNFKARIIAATNKDLKKAVNYGSFREDLYYRLFVLPIDVPPLRKRKDDIPILLNHFGKLSSMDSKIEFKNFSETSISLCLNYDWPGNIRELQNFVTRSIILADGKEITSEIVNRQLDVGSFVNKIIPDIIPETWEEMDAMRKEVSDKASRTVEKIFLENLLDKFGGNVTKAANEIGKNRSNLHKMMKKCGL